MLVIAVMTFAAACGGSHDGAKPIGVPCNGSCDMTGTWVGRRQSDAYDVKGAFVVELVQAGGQLSGSIDLPAVSSGPLAITGKVNGGQRRFRNRSKGSSVAADRDDKADSGMIVCQKRTMAIQD